MSFTIVPFPQYTAMKEEKSGRQLTWKSQHKLIEKKLFLFHLRIRTKKSEYKEDKKRAKIKSLSE